jgi:hypothetical protein
MNYKGNKLEMQGTMCQTSYCGTDKLIEGQKQYINFKMAMLISQGKTNIRNIEGCNQKRLRSHNIATFTHHTTNFLQLAQKHQQFHVFVKCLTHAIHDRHVGIAIAIIIRVNY